MEALWEHTKQPQRVGGANCPDNFENRRARSERDRRLGRAGSRAERSTNQAIRWPAPMALSNEASPMNWLPVLRGAWLRKIAPIVFRMPDCGYLRWGEEPMARCGNSNNFISISDAPMACISKHANWCDRRAEDVVTVLCSRTRRRCVRRDRPR